MQQLQPLFAPTAEDFASARLISYAALQWPGYRDAAHHRLIARKLEAVERGEIDRLMITMPPRHGKSMLASEYFPAWYLGRNPDHYVVAATYSQDLADDFGRKVRNQISDQLYRRIFPGVGLAGDSSSIKRFHIEGAIGGVEHQLKQRGAYYAVGVGGPLTGRGAHLLLIDDPVKNREEADSETYRKKVKDWYTSTAYTRLMPGGRVVVIQCLPGDTLISMEGGLQKPIKDILVGERVNSWDGKGFVSAKISAVIDNGYDQTYLIKTKNGDVKANARHPFLVLTKDGLKWIRTSCLRSGMLMSRKGGGKVAEWSAPQLNAVSKPGAVDCASLITTKQNGHLGIGRLRFPAHTVFQSAGNGVMALISRNLTRFLPNRAAYALSANLMGQPVGLSIGLQTLFPITTMKRESCEGFFATIATELPDELAIPEFWNERSNTSALDTDEIISVEPFGFERVYDLTVDGTHNFVANGFLSHNTRWHEADLSGWLLEEHAHEGWDVLSLPAIDAQGNALWPEQYDLASLERIRRALPVRDWSALYQQQPTPEEGDYFNKEWLIPVITLPNRENLRIYGASDYAVTADGGDFTVHVVIGIDPDGHMWLLDLWRKQSASDEWVEAFCALVLKWRPLEWAEETGQIKSGVGPFLEKEMRAKRAFVRRHQFPTRGDKAIRAQSIRGRMAMDGLRIPAAASWRNDLLIELLRFPAGVNDDQVDALGLAGQLLDKMLPGQATKPQPIAGLANDYKRSSPSNGQEIGVI